MAPACAAGGGAVPRVALSELGRRDNNEGYTQWCYVSSRANLSLSSFHFWPDTGELWKKEGKYLLRLTAHDKPTTVGGRGGNHSLVTSKGSTQTLPGFF